MTVFMTGFPGFLGSALLPGILKRTDGEAMCLVQDKFAALARRRVAELNAADPSLHGRIQLIAGDITQPGLGLDAGALNGVSEAWHLAAAYDLASEGRTYQLADPRPPTVDELIDTIAEAIGRNVIKVPLPRKLAKSSLAHVPPLYWLMRIPPQAVDYFAHPTFYLTDHCRADLAGSQIEAPPFSSYVDRLVGYMRGNPAVGSAAMF